MRDADDDARAGNAPDPLALISTLPRSRRTGPSTERTAQRLAVVSSPDAKRPPLASGRWYRHIGEAGCPEALIRRLRRHLPPRGEGNMRISNGWCDRYTNRCAGSASTKCLARCPRSCTNRWALRFFSVRRVGVPAHSKRTVLTSRRLESRTNPENRRNPQERKSHDR
jgi:hypothetical protein